MKKTFVLLLMALIILVYAPMASAAMTVSNVEWVSMGNKKAVICDIAFDSSYAYGGEALAGMSMGGMTKVEMVIADSEKNGYTFSYDYDNEKIKVFTKAPPIVYEEKITITESSEATLMYPAAYVMAVVQSTGKPYRFIHSGATTLGVGDWALNAEIADGERTGITTYAAGTYYVTYVTQAWKDYYDLLVQNEEVTLATGASTTCLASGNTIFALMGGKTGAAGVTFVSTGYGGKHEIGADFGQSGTSTSYLYVNPNDNAYVLYLTYLKYPAADTWLKNHFIFEEDATAGTSSMILDRSLLTWNISGAAFDAGVSNVWIGLEDVAPTGLHLITGGMTMQPAWGYRGVAADAAVPDNHQVWAVPDSGAFGLTDGAYVWGQPWEIPNLRPLEVLNGTDLSDLTGVRLIVIGY